MQTLTQYELQPLHVLMLSVLVLYLGFYLNRKIRFLREFFIPPAVTGGLICSIVLAIIYAAADVEVTFDMQIRDVLLLIFFSTIGLTAKLRMLAAGGKALAIMVVVAATLATWLTVPGLIRRPRIGAKAMATLRVLSPSTKQARIMRSIWGARRA